MKYADPIAQAELDLDAIEAEHVGEDCDCIPPCAAWCARCGDVWPCAAVRLVAAVRTLTAENERLRRWKAEAVEVRADNRGLILKLHALTAAVDAYKRYLPATHYPLPDPEESDV